MKTDSCLRQLAAPFLVMNLISTLLFCFAIITVLQPPTTNADSVAPLTPDSHSGQTTAPTTVTVTLPNSSADTGADVLIPITVTDLSGQGVISYDLSVQFDESVLQPLNPSFDIAGTLSNGMTVTPNTSQAGRFIISAFGTAALSGPGALIRLRFNVVGGPGASTALTFQSFTFNEGMPAASTVNGSFTVPGGECTYTVSPSSSSISSFGGNRSFTVSAPAGCAWTATSNVNWITTTSSGSGNGTVNYSVAPNSSPGPRSGTITLQGQSHTVMQSGVSTNCIQISFPTGLSGGAGASLIVPVGVSNLTGSNVFAYDFVLSFNQSVLQLQNPSFDSTGTLSSGMTITANTSVPGRVTISAFSTTPLSGSGTLINLRFDLLGPGSMCSDLAWISFRFNEGNPCAFTSIGRVCVGSCSYSITPTSASFSSAGGNGIFTVTTNPSTGCNWTATSNVGWITTTSSGSGDGSVTYSVAPNMSSSIRSGTIDVAGLSFTVFQGIEFTDVPVGHPFFTEISKLSSRGVTLGCGVGIYCPDEVVTRQQMAAFIIRALGDPVPPPPGMQRFADVGPENPFYSFIEQMAIRQITLGCGGGNYCPTDPVLRDQMAAFIIRALGEFNPPDPPFQRFADVSPSNAFYRFIDRMAVLGITLGCGGGNYCPSLEVSRGQMAAFLVRAFNL